MRIQVVENSTPGRKKTNRMILKNDRMFARVAESGLTFLSEH